MARGLYLLHISKPIRAVCRRCLFLKVGRYPMSSNLRKISSPFHNQHGMRLPSPKASPTSKPAYPGQLGLLTVAFLTPFQADWYGRGCLNLKSPTGEAAKGTPRKTSSLNAGRWKPWSVPFLILAVGGVGWCPSPLLEGVSGEANVDAANATSDAKLLVRISFRQRDYGNSFEYTTLHYNILLTSCTSIN